VSNSSLKTANEQKLTSHAWRILGRLALAFGLCANLCIQRTAHGETPAGYLQKQRLPAFKEGHGLPRLTRFGWTLPFEARVELARHWGYALELGGYTTEEVVQRLKDPESIETRLVELARSEPETFPLQAILSRELPTGDVEAIAEPPSVAETEPADQRSPDKTNENAHFERGGVNAPGDAWTRNAEGELVEGKRVWSPEAPRDIVQGAADLASDHGAQKGARAGGQRLALTLADLRAEIAADDGAGQPARGFARTVIDAGAGREHEPGQTCGDCRQAFHGILPLPFRWVAVAV